MCNKYSRHVPQNLSLPINSKLQLLCEDFRRITCQASHRCSQPLKQDFELSFRSCQTGSFFQASYHNCTPNLTRYKFKNHANQHFLSHFLLNNCIFQWITFPINPPPNWAGQLNYIPWKTFAGPRNASRPSRSPGGLKLALKVLSLGLGVPLFPKDAVVCTDGLDG